MSELIAKWGNEFSEDAMTPEELAEETKGMRFDYPRIKIPSGGILQFELPNLDDPSEPLYSKTIQAILLHQHSLNSYWSDPSISGVAPDCTAPDGENGFGNPGGNCAACPLNQWGSGEAGRGKACKSTRRLYILTKESAIPWILSLPVTSIKSFWDFYKLSFLAAGRSSTSALIEIGLTRQENNSGNAYSVATFKIVGRLEENLSKNMRARRAQLVDLLKNEPVITALPEGDGIPF